MDPNHILGLGGGGELGVGLAELYFLRFQKNLRQFFVVTALVPQRFCWRDCKNLFTAQNIDLSMCFLSILKSVALGIAIHKLHAAKVIYLKVWDTVLDLANDCG